MALPSLARKLLLSQKPDILLSRRSIVRNNTMSYETQSSINESTRWLVSNYSSTGSNAGILESARWMSGFFSSTAQPNEVLLYRMKPFLMKDRGFARIASPPPHLQRQMGMKLYQGSPGIVIDPYRVRSRLPFFQRWFTREGWQQIREYLLHELKSAYAIAKLRQKAGYTRKKFYSEACTLYKQLDIVTEMCNQRNVKFTRDASDMKRTEPALMTEINSAIAQGDRNTLKHFVTDNMFSIIKNELKQREAVWSRIHWEVVGPIKIQTLQARMASSDAKNIDKAYIQLTLKIRSNQKFGAFAKTGDILAGDPDKEIVVEDIWVFETKLGLPETKWHLCARITL